MYFLEASTDTPEHSHFSVGCSNTPVPASVEISSSDLLSLQQAENEASNFLCETFIKAYHNKPPCSMIKSYSRRWLEQQEAEIANFTCRTEALALTSSSREIQYCGSAVLALFKTILSCITGLFIPIVTILNLPLEHGVTMTAQINELIVNVPAQFDN